MNLSTGLRLGVSHVDISPLCQSALEGSAGSGSVGAFQCRVPGR